MIEIEWAYFILACIAVALTALLIGVGVSISLHQNRILRKMDERRESARSEWKRITTVGFDQSYKNGQGRKKE